MERVTHIDFNRDNVIGRLPDVYYGYPSLYGNFPQTGYGGYFPPGSSYGSAYGY